MAQRKPTVGGDSGNWGQILNDYLGVSLNSDGTINSNTVSDTQVASGASINPTKINGTAEVQSNKNQPSGYAGLNGSGVVPTTRLGSGSAGNAAYLRGDSSWAAIPTDTNRTRSVTIVVAASNTDAKGKAAADYVCTGTSSTGGDEVTIQQALQTIANSPQKSGKVVLLAGIYWRTNPIYLDISSTTIEGQGDSTQITVASNAAGYASVIIGSNGVYDGVHYIGGDSAPTVVPTESRIRDILIQDWAGYGSALPGSNHGLVVRGGDIYLDDITIKETALDGIRYEGFRQMGVTGTLGGSVSTTPTWGTQEIWTVNGASGAPATPFIALVGTADYDPELVNVAGISGSSWTVQRGYMQSTIKTHNNGDGIAVLNYTTVFNNISRNCYVYSCLRDAFMMQQGVDDSEWFACIVGGGPSKTSMYTRNGFWCGASNVRFIACHPYFCSQFGFYSSSYTAGNPTCIIIAGEYETNGSTGIYIQQSANCTITGGVSIFANATYDIQCSYTTGMTISDVWMSSPIYRHIYVDKSTEVSIHDVHVTGENTGVMFEIQGGGVNTNAEIDIHDNILQASGSSYPTAIELNDIAGVAVHDNVLEEGILESNGSDYNSIHHNTMVDPTKGITLIGAHSQAWDNQGVTDFVYSNAATVNAQSRKFYQLDGTSNTVALNPPGSGTGAIALAAASIGVTLPVTTLTLASAPTTYSQSGIVIVPISSGYTTVKYESISGSTLTGCTGGSGTTASGNTYIAPDLSTRFRVSTTNTTNQVSIACPPGMTINGSSNSLVLSIGTIYDATMSGSSGWYIQGRTQIINTGADGNKGLVIVPNSGTQSANLQEWQDTTGDPLFAINSAGVPVSTGNTVGNAAFRGLVKNDVQARLQIANTGYIGWGDGADARDTFLSRSSAGVLNVQNALSIAGLTGATAASRYAGATVSGAPASGTFVAGDFVIDLSGTIWICTIAGTPGTWIQPAGTGGSIINMPQQLYGYISWSFDQAALSGGASPGSAGVVTLIKIPWPNTVNVTNIVIQVSAGGTLTSNECFAGIYASSGTLLGTTADQSGLWNSAGTIPKTMAITSGPISVPGGGANGFVYVALLWNGSVSPSFFKALAGSPAINGNLSAATLRCANNSTGNTALPGSLTLSNSTGAASLFWAALS